MMEIRYRTGQYSPTDPTSHIWEALDSGEVIGELYVSTDRTEIMNIEVRADRRGEGIARRLYEAAADEVAIHHAPVGHRTPEGDAFARAVGGPTAAYACDCHACDTETEES